jgi:hypothetical protein
MTMRKILIVALICINAGLLAALVVSVASPAKAQVPGGGTDYLMISGKIHADGQAVYVLDLSKRQLRAWEFNRTTPARLTPFLGRDLTKDFGRK